ncbi:MAG TPA: YfhO family protein, partial [Thermoanaerobaculia bacterium]|nr:YfhO family protein [Thermoanaerobaculia bacterium]
AGWSCATSIVLFILWPLGFAWTFFPLVLLGVRRASLPLLTTAFTLLLLAGHPETALHVVFLAGFYALLQKSRRVILISIASGLIALALSAIFILPILEAAPQTMEHVTRTGQFAELPRGVPSDEVLKRLATDVFPYLHARIEGVPIDTSAVGSIILALAICAVWRVRSRESWFFAGVALFGILAHSEWTPLARALQQLPLFDQSLNERFSFAAALALAMLAAMAVEHLNVRDAVITCLAVLALLAIGNALIETTRPRDWGRYAIAAELAGLALATIAVWRRAPYAILALVLAQRGVSEGGIYRSFEPRAAYPPIPILEPLKNVHEPFRITGHGRAFIPGTSALYELEDVRGYQAMTFRRYRETYDAWCVHQPVWFNRVDDLTRPFLSFLNVRYAITWDRDPPPDGWREVARQQGSILIENTRVIDRIFVPRAVRLGHPALAEMQSETDFRERAWIEADLPPQERANGPGRVTFNRRAAGEWEIDATMEGDGWIVASFPAWKGWRAYVDGRRVETQFANHAFLGIFVPKGRHHVRLVYRPDAFVVGRTISLTTLVLLVLLSAAKNLRPGSRRSAG